MSVAPIASRHSNRKAAVKPPRLSERFRRRSLALGYAAFDLPNTGRINHSMASADGDDHTNWVERYSSRLRRMPDGQHHHVSAHYLAQYANEAAWKEDHRRTATRYSPRP
jgi:hypothetical protein